MSFKTVTKSKAGRLALKDMRNNTITCTARSKGMYDRFKMSFSDLDNEETVRLNSQLNFLN